MLKLSQVLNSMIMEKAVAKGKRTVYTEFN